MAKFTIITWTPHVGLFNHTWTMWKETIDRVLAFWSESVPKKLKDEMVDYMLDQDVRWREVL